MSATLLCVCFYTSCKVVIYELIDLVITLCSVGFFAGFLVSSVLIAVFGGVANAIIVCFAERPHILENMHPVSVRSIFCRHYGLRSTQSLTFSVSSHLHHTEPICHAVGWLVTGVA